MNSIGNLYIVSAPSGAGKTSLTTTLVNQIDHIKISVSYTTRPARPNEKSDIDYHFIKETDFQRMLEESAFLEHAEVYGCYYGTEKNWVQKQLKQGIDVLLEIDWQGAFQIKRLFSSAILIFILPPSMKALQNRLKKRSQDAPKTIAQRMHVAKVEMMYHRKFDYLIINDDFDTALMDLTHIVQAERLRSQRQQKIHANLLENLLETH